MKKINKRKKSILILLIILIFILAYYMYVLYFPSFKEVSFYDYNKINKKNINIVVEDKLQKLEAYPFIKNKKIFFPVTFLKKYIDNNIYWENDSNKLIITTLNKLAVFMPEYNTYKINYKQKFLKTPLENIDNIAYIPLDILEEFYNFKINYMENDNIITLDYFDKDIKYGQITGKKQIIRHEGNVKSPILKKIYLNEELVVFDYEKNNKYTKVRTKEGFIGYIKTKKLKITKIDKKNLLKTIKKEKLPKNKKREKINLLWDNVTNIQASNNPKKRINHKGVNILSPTWLSFDKETLDGDIKNISSIEYVDWAHKNGYRVWALLSDKENSHITSKVLSSANKREKAILNILEICEKYNLDGINIDFERVPQSHVDYFLQFLRELTPVLREKGIIVSVDTFVPSLWSMYYNRAEIGRIVDYVIVMTYDENSGADKSGPNASIQFVEKGIKDTIFEIPKEKVIMGIPFYVRIWKEKEQEEEIIYKSRSVSMDYAYKILLEENAEIKWIKDMGLYYGEFEKEEEGEIVNYRIWLEDKNSIKEKLKLVKKYNLAGVASWARGLEGDGIFKLINDNLNNL